MTASQLNLVATILLFTSVLVAIVRYMHPATFSVTTYSILLAASVVLLAAAIIRRA